MKYPSSERKLVFDNYHGLTHANDLGFKDQSFPGASGKMNRLSDEEVRVLASGNFS